MNNFCFVLVPGARPGYRIALVRRGERGWLVTDYDDGTLPLWASDAGPDGWSIEEYVRELNQRVGVARDEANLMLCGAILGWRAGQNSKSRLSEHAPLTALWFIDRLLSDRDTEPPYAV
jgi:hypothetical protein